MNRSVSFSITGDSLIVKRLCRSSPSSERLRALLSSGDVCFTNLETSVHNFEPDIYPARYSGGDWVATPPQVLEDLKWLGFNLFAVPNNHSLDWSHSGLLHTLENLERAGTVFSGAGRNLADACAPKYLETPGGRVALISCCSTFEPWHMAGEQRRDLQGRPGIFGIEFDRIHGINREELTILEELCHRLRRDGDGWVREGEEQLFCFGGDFYQTGISEEITRVKKSSLSLLSRSIQEAKRQADLVVVSLHSHERRSEDPHIPADFQKEIAHFSIDCGAHVFIGHGPHVMRGIELYRGQPIIHGLGNFFYQCELLSRAPAEFYTKFGTFPPDTVTADIYDYRVSHGGILGETNPDYFTTAVVFFTLTGGKLDRLTVHPVSLQFKAHRASKGSPVLADPGEADHILGQMEALSEQFGTRLARSGSNLELKLSQQ